MAESVLPETDDDAVRIMTIHAAKGLEFPITIVSGLSPTRRATEPGRGALPKDGGPVGYRMGKDVITEEFEAAVPIDEQMGYDERLRLLYVACTRACDHLVLSLHRVDRKNPPAKKRSRTNAEVLHHGMVRSSTTCPTSAANRRRSRPIRQSGRRRQHRSRNGTRSCAALLAAGDPGRWPPPPSPTKPSPIEVPTCVRRWAAEAAT